MCIHKDIVKVKLWKDLSSVSATGFHQLWLQIQHKQMTSIPLCATYKPPECPTTGFTDDFSDNYMKALSFGKDVFILGDLNCNLLKNCPEGNTLNDLCATLNLKQLVILPTRVMEHSSSLIEVMKVMETHISDHFLIYSVLNLNSPKALPNYIKTRTTTLRASY